MRKLTKKEDIAEFLSTHYGEITGLYNDKFYRNGSHNGTMNAISEVETRYNVEIDTTDTDIDLQAVLEEVVTERELR